MRLYVLFLLTAFGLLSCKPRIVSFSNSARDLGLCPYVFCGSAGNSCYENVAAKAAGRACLSDGTSIDYFTNSNGFSVWKETTSDRILKATGLWSSPADWQKNLMRAGTAFTTTDFTNYSNLAGRACPTHVFLNHSNMIATEQCLYFDLGTDLDTLDSDAGVVGEDYLSDWRDLATGNGLGASWYEGNIKACADQGMRLPTLYETTADAPPDGLPVDANPVFSGSLGVPTQEFFSWTASALAESSITHFWLWSGNLTDFGDNYFSAPSARCVLPAN